MNVGDKVRVTTGIGSYGLTGTVVRMDSLTTPKVTS